jgi:group I intron endonuclease
MKSVLRQYHYLYKITNLINNKIYIGIHSTNKLDDRYFGSGHVLKRAVIKNGELNFSIKILEWFDWRCEALSREAEIVNAEFVKRDDTYNVSFGGAGGIVSHSDKTIQKIRENRKGKGIGREVSTNTRLKLSLANSGRIHSLGSRINMRNSHIGHKASNESRLKISQSLYKQCVIDGVMYKNIDEAIEILNLNISKKVGLNRIRSKSEVYSNWRYA